MDEQQRLEILGKAKEFFKEIIAKNHVSNTVKLRKLSAFKVNPFLINYLSAFAFGDDSPESIAKALIYPRALGTSITTSFGTHMQQFCNFALSSLASVVSGIDIEFTDALDGRKKYCQTKSGPETINKDDVTTIKNHFTAIRNLARTNQLLDLNPSKDCIVGVFYGEPAELNAHYQALDNDFHVYIGKEFWHRLTGDENFYEALIDSFVEVAQDVDGRDLLQETITRLGSQIARSRGTI